MEMCVHATIGSLFVLLNIERAFNKNFKVKTPLGFINIDLRKEFNKKLIFIEQFEPVFSVKNPSLEEVITALNIRDSDIDLTIGPIQSVSSSRPKLLIPLTDYSVLSSLKPNYEYLWDLCDKYQTTGFYPFSISTRDKTLDVEARQFPKNAGYVEDPATGVAAGALASFLTKYKVLPKIEKNDVFRYKIGQGFDMGKPSIIYAENGNINNVVSKPFIGGTAIIEKKEKIELDQKNIRII